MTIKIKKKNIYEWIPPILLLMPYLDRGWIRHTFLYSKNGVYFYPILIFMIVVGCVFAFITRHHVFCSRLRQIIRGTSFLAFLTFLSGAVISILNNNFAVFAVQFMWLFIPIWYAWEVYAFICHKKLNIGNIVDKYLGLFAAYCVFSIAIQMYSYGFYFGSSIRLGGGSGSGGLLFSYTVAIVFGLLILRKKHIPAVKRILLAGIYFLFAILSGSRGAIFIILFELVLYFFSYKKTYQRIMMVSAAFFFAVIGNPMEYIYQIAPRLLELSDNKRAQTISSTLNVFSQQGILRDLFGNGLGQFFPYQEWLGSINSLYGTIHFKNIISINGELFLVQPHNTYIHLLLEIGIIGLAVFMIILFLMMKFLLNTHVGECRRNLLIIFFIICAFNCLDAVFSMAPGIASIWWILTLIVIGYKDAEKEGSVSSL